MRAALGCSGVATSASVTGDVPVRCDLGGTGASAAAKGGALVVVKRAESDASIAARVRRREGDEGFFLVATGVDVEGSVCGMDEGPKARARGMRVLFSSAARSTGRWQVHGADPRRCGAREHEPARAPARR